jgi:4-diphosphocytidyl-2-C-methyl-D-erythritol kinase
LAESAARLRAAAPAKLNLTLGVGPRRADGFHPLRSVFMQLGLADELIVDFAPADGTGDQLSVEGDPRCPTEGNLVVRAFELVRSAVGQPLPPLSATLVKRTPLGAGLGGGSSDGAAALALAEAAWGVGLAPVVRQEVEERLGSDVPFFARGGAVALVEGRGERVTPLAALDRPVGVLLAVSAEPLGTPAVYARFDEIDAAGTGADRATSELVDLLSGGADGVRLAGHAPRLADANDLWPAAMAIAPQLARRRDTLERLSGRRWALTGSGPTLFALYPSVDQAASEGERLAGELATDHEGLRLIATHGGTPHTQEDGP